MLIGDNYHLTYCTNVYPSNTWDEMFSQLQLHLPKIKKSISPSKAFGVGLYLSNKASLEILHKTNLSQLKLWLKENELYVFTMNGFPFGDFHGEVVKDNVYKPDWTTPERIEYTKRLFGILAEILPPDIDGGISTSPVSYKYWFGDESQTRKVFEIAHKHFVEMALFLKELSDKSGKHFHLDIEPEPDCLLENSDEAISFFNRLVQYSPKNEEVIRKHINLCFDICHFSVEYEEPEVALAKLISNGVLIGKIQVSAALKAVFQYGKMRQESLLNHFRIFDERKYFHQTVVRNASDKRICFRDLSNALESIEQDHLEWRTHFHVPIFLSGYGELLSTQDDVVKTLKFLKSNQITSHLEVETYTWDVLPAELKTDMDESIIRELEWVKQNLLTV